MSVLKSAMENPDLRRVMVAFAGFNVATYGTWLAMMVYAYRVGGINASGVIGALLLLPAAVFAPFASTLGDRYRRERVLVTGYVVQAVAAGTAGIVMVRGAPLLVVYILATLTTLSMSVTRPVQGALLPLLSRTVEELTAANVASSWIEGLGMFAGPFIAGVLLAVTWPGAVFMVMAGVCACGAFLTAGISAERVRNRSAIRDESVAREMFSGFRVIWKERRPRLIVSLLSAHFVLMGSTDILFVILAFRLLSMGSPGVGFLNAAFGIGVLMGAALTLTLIGRRHFAPPLLWGAFVWGIGLSVMGIQPNRVVAPLCIVVAGIGRPLLDVSGRTLLQRVTADQVLSRVFGMLEGLALAAWAAGMLLVPALFDSLGNRTPFLILAALLPALVILAWRSLWATDTSTAVPTIRVKLLRTVPFFAPLPPDILDTLAAHLIPIDAEPGEIIIRQGESGDRFYIVEEGQVDIVKSGMPVDQDRPGGFFGEIALLHDVPRTATVIATSPTRLYALEREPFLTAITHNPHSRREVESVAHTRIAPQEEATPLSTASGD